MAMFKCKMCGGNLEINKGCTTCECEYCGRVQTVPALDNEKKTNLFNRANRLRFNNEFDKAAGIYESIVSEFPEESEAYWGLCLCKYGIEYVDDPATGKKIPTCHRTSFDSIFKDSNFELACEYTDMTAQSVYREEAKEIDRLQKAILDIANKEEPYDIFICYKETAPDGQRTKDSVMAQDIYDALTAKGYKVFFARITLEDKLGQEYEPYIFSALNSSKVMLSVGTKYEYFNSVWVKNEWSRYLDMMKKDKGKVLIPCYADIDAYDMPEEFKNLQGQDMGKVGFIQDLVRGVGKIVNPTPNITSDTEKVIDEVYFTNHGYKLLKSQKYDEAADMFTRGLERNMHFSAAYWGLILATSNLIDSQDFCGKSFAKKMIYAFSVRDNQWRCYDSDVICSKIKQYYGSIYEDFEKNADRDYINQINGLVKKLADKIILIFVDEYDSERIKPLIKRKDYIQAEELMESLKKKIKNCDDKEVFNQIEITSNNIYNNLYDIAESMYSSIREMKDIKGEYNILEKSLNLYQKIPINFKDSYQKTIACEKRMKEIDDIDKIAKIKLKKVNKFSLVFFLAFTITIMIIFKNTKLSVKEIFISKAIISCILGLCVALFALITTKIKVINETMSSLIHGIISFITIEIFFLIKDIFSNESLSIINVIGSVLGMTIISFIPSVIILILSCLLSYSISSVFLDGIASKKNKNFKEN